MLFTQLGRGGGGAGIRKEHEMNTGLPFRVIHHFHNVYCNLLVVRPCHIVRTNSSALFEADVNYREFALSCAY